MFSDRPAPKAEMFSKEIMKVDGKFVALPLIFEVGDVYLNGCEGHGDVCYSFNIKTVEGTVTKVHSQEIPYYAEEHRYDRWLPDDEKPIYINAKIEALTVRDEVVKLWAEYLENKA